MSIVWTEHPIIAHGRDELLADLNRKINRLTSTLPPNMNANQLQNAYGRLDNLTLQKQYLLGEDIMHMPDTIQAAINQGLIYPGHYTQDFEKALFHEGLPRFTQNHIKTDAWSDFCLFYNRVNETLSELDFAIQHAEFNIENEPEVDIRALRAEIAYRDVERAILSNFHEHMAREYDIDVEHPDLASRGLRVKLPRLSRDDSR